MNDDTRSYPYNSFAPLLLLSLSWAFVLIWQLANVTQQRSALEQSKVQLEAAYNQSTPQQEQLIAQAHAVQGKLETLVNDLLELSRGGDADAHAIVDKYKIQRQEPAAAPAASASPSASPGR